MSATKASPDASANASDNASKGPERLSKRPPWYRRRLTLESRAQGSLLMVVCTIVVLFICFLVGCAVAWRLRMDAIAARGGETNGLDLILFMEVFGGALLLSSASLYAVNFYSNRLFGPIWRIHRDMRRVLDGGEPEPIAFRPGDAFPEFAESYNKLTAELHSLRERAKRTGG